MILSDTMFDGAEKCSINIINLAEQRNLDVKVDNELVILELQNIAMCRYLTRGTNCTHL